MTAAEALDIILKTRRPLAYEEGRYDGVRNLWAKVLIRAAFDWVTYRDSKKLIERKTAESAYTWMFKQSELLNSFESLCRYLGVSPDYARSRIKLLTKEDVMKAEHVERNREPREMSRRSDTFLL